MILKSLERTEVNGAWGNGFGDFGPKPDFSSVDRSPAQLPMTVTFAFRDSAGSEAAVSDFNQSDVLLFGWRPSNFIKISDSTYSFDANASTKPQRIIVQVLAGAAIDDEYHNQF